MPGATRMSRLPALALVAFLPMVVHAEPVWHRQDACPTAQRASIQVEVHGEGATTPLYRSTWRLCRLERTATDDTTRDDADTFDAGRIAARVGIADGDTLEASVWEAGMERDGVVLGFSLQTTKRVMSHALYPIRVTERERHALGDGLELRVAPAK